MYTQASYSAIEEDGVKVASSLTRGQGDGGNVQKACSTDCATLLWREDSGRAEIALIVLVHLGT